MKRLFCITCIFLFAQCSKNLELNNPNFKILLPKNWKEIELKGIDSKVYGVLTSKKDTVIFDYGLYSSSFKETIKVFSKKQIQKYDSLKMDTKDLKWSKLPEIDQNQAVFHNSYYYYDTINGEIGKVKVPKTISKGITGISFRNINNTVNHLTIMGRNLDLKERNELLKSFKTINFK